MTRYYKMQAVDANCGSLTWRTWVVPDTPDFAAALYTGSYCPPSQNFTDVTVASTWIVDDGSGGGAQALFLVATVAQVSSAVYDRVGAVQLPVTADTDYVLHLLLETSDVTNAAWARLYDIDDGAYVAGSEQDCDAETPTAFDLAVTLAGTHRYELHLKQAVTDPAEAAFCVSAWLEGAILPPI